MEILNDLNFEEKALKNEKPVLIDFFATWCGPCRQMLPIVNEISEEIKNLDVFEIDVDEAPATADKFEIQSIPHLILFNKGKVIAQKNGACTKAELIQWITENT